MLTVLQGCTEVVSPSAKQTRYMVYGMSTRESRLRRNIPNKAEFPTVSAITLAPSEAASREGAVYSCRAVREYTNLGPPKRQDLLVCREKRELPRAGLR